MIVVALFWALGTVVCKNAFGETPETFRVHVFNGLRFPIASAAIFLLLRITGAPLGIRREHILGMASVSFFGMFLFMVLFNIGLSLTTASNAGIYLGAIPLIIVIVSLFRGTDHPEARLIAGILIGMCGVVLVNGQAGVFGFNRGDLLALASGVCWAIYAVWGEKFLKIYPPMLATAWILLFLSLFYLPLFLHDLPRQTWSGISPANWGNLAYSSLGALVLANTFYFVAIRHIGPSRSGIYINLEPPFTLLLAFFLRGEHITFFQIAGLTVVIFGVILARTNGRETEPEPAN
jgi:drug/metabolite transporter (DMT)-like permease